MTLILENIDLIVLFLLISFSGEIVATILFVILSNRFKSGTRNVVNFKSITKGMLERLFIFLSLVNQFPQSLIVFGALKIATRLGENENQVTNDYFLVGNLVSLILSIVYYLFWNLIIH